MMNAVERSMYFDRAGVAIDVETWSRLATDESYKRIAVTVVSVGGDPARQVEVSTVWLGMDHRFFGDGPPVIFETMVFGDDSDNFHSDRYSTEEQARTGHAELVATVSASTAYRQAPIVSRDDIVDEIDRLVHDQLEQTPSGYDHNLNQDYCPHPWCSEQWHGLAITTRMREMRDMHHSTIAYYEDTERVSPEVAAALEAYRYNEDDSEVICPGSGFVGEFTPPTRPTPRKVTLSLDVQTSEVAEELREALNAWTTMLTCCCGSDGPDTFTQHYHLPAEALDGLPEGDETPAHRYMLGFDGSRQGGMVGMTIVDETLRFELEREGES